MIFHMIKKIFFMFLIFPAFGLASDKKPEWKCGKWDTLLAGPPEVLKGDVKFLFETLMVPENYSGNLTNLLLLILN